MFSSCIFQVSISIGTFVSNSLSLSTTDGTKWTSFKYDWGVWWKVCVLQKGIDGVGLGASRNDEYWRPKKDVTPLIHELKLRVP